MTFADKDSADENSDTDTDSSDGSNKDLLSKVSQENIFLPLHGSTPVGNILGNLHGTGGSTDSDVAGSSAVALKIWCWIMEVCVKMEVSLEVQEVALMSLQVRLGMLVVKHVWMKIEFHASLEMWKMMLVAVLSCQ